MKNKKSQQVVSNDISEKDLTLILDHEENHPNPLTVKEIHGVLHGYPFVYAEPIECPECGEETKTLHNGGAGLMCEGCCDEYASHLMEGLPYIWEDESL